MSNNQISKKTAKQFLDSLKKYRKILIIIKGSPDPDAIAASYAVQTICTSLEIKSEIIAAQILSLPQNRAFTENLFIQVKFLPPVKEVDKYDAYIVTDHPSPVVDGVTGKIPCAVHIDHHQGEGEYEVMPDFHLINTEAGSASSLVALLIRELKLDIDLSAMTLLATALLYGIETDTDKYEHVSKIDYEAIDYISGYSDSTILTRISTIPLSKKTLKLLKEAISNQVIYKDWLISGIGFVDSTCRDSIAIVADFILKREKISTVIIFAIIEYNDRNKMALDASFRSEKEHLNLNSIIKRITSEGGARKYKGAYQVNLDYFTYCPDKEMLWKVVEKTTVETLIKSRDDLYITEIKGFYNTIKGRISKLIKSK